MDKMYIFSNSIFQGDFVKTFFMSVIDSHEISNKISIIMCPIVYHVGRA